MTYGELSVFGRLRKIDKIGLWGMWTKLPHLWGDHLIPREIAEKATRFFRFHAINRHKQAVLTPSYHAEQYSPDDDRFDLRPFLYPVFSWSLKKTWASVERLEKGVGTTDLVEAREDK